MWPQWGMIKMIMVIAMHRMQMIGWNFFLEIPIVGSSLGIITFIELYNDFSEQNNKEEPKP